jgi:hypothetical protein
MVQIPAASVEAISVASSREPPATAERRAMYTLCSTNPA